MTVYLAAAHFADVNPLREDGSIGEQDGSTDSGDIIPSTYPDRNGLRFALYSPSSPGGTTLDFYDFLTSETPVPIDTTPKWVHVWWDLRTGGGAGNSVPSSDAFAIYCSDGTRLLNFANIDAGLYLQVYDNTGAVVFSDYTTDYPGRSEYATHEINIKITGGSPGNVTVYEGKYIIANVDIPNINTDIARIRLAQPNAEALYNYFQELLIADFDTRGARVKNITLSAATTDTSTADTVEANVRSYTGNHGTYTNRTGIIFDTDGQKVFYPGDGTYVKDDTTVIKEVRLRTYSSAEAGTAVPNIVPTVSVSGTEYPQTTIVPTTDFVAVDDPVVLTNSPATSTAWTEVEIQSLGFGLEAEV